MHEYSTPKQMKRIGDLFEKYRLCIKAPQATVEKACVRAIQDVTGLTVEQEQITYNVSTGTLHLTVASVLKSELKIHQTAIIQALEKELGDTVTSRTLL